MSIPISLKLTDTTGATQFVAGMSSTGLNDVCAGLIAQNNIDGAGWNQLIVKNSAGQNLRALSPNNGLVLNNNLFANYWTSYVNQVYAKYASTPLSVDTQASFGTITGQVSNNNLTFPNNITFAKPTARDIFSCSTGPFADTSGERGAIVPRIAAAFNRSTLLVNTNTPNVALSQYYQNQVTNHYSRIVHAANLDGLGYAFPYDDVSPTGGSNQAGTVSSGIVSVFRVAVGGVGATAKASAMDTSNVKTSVPAEKEEDGAQKKLGQGSNSPQSRPTGQKLSLFQSIRKKFQELSRSKTS